MCFKKHADNTHVQTSFMALWQPVLQSCDGAEGALCTLTQHEVKLLFSEFH